MFPRGFADEVRAGTDILRIVSEYVALKKRGANWIGLCPFHSEKTPSFNVHPGKGIFKCFGCSAGGTVFDFVMLIEGLGFAEAVTLVAEKSGIPIPERTAPRAEEERKERWRSRLLDLNEQAATFFEQQLGAGPAGRAALDYLELRGINSTTRERLRVGYAPDAWDALTNFLLDRGAQRNEIADSGLVTNKEGGGFYDRFRNRVIFPIHDAQGRIVAFGGRTLGDDRAKYLNSPETAVYTKGKHLFGLFHAKEAIRRAGFAILVEGYLDAVIPQQEGVANVVASLGTALTQAQARLLRRYMESPQVIVNYDPDTAGQEATARSFETLLGEGFRVNVLRLPDAKDPDEFVREQGAAAYRALLKSSQPYLEYLLDRAIEHHDTSKPSGKRAAVEELLPHIALLQSGIERSAYADRVATRLGVSDNALRSEIRRAAERRENRLDEARLPVTETMTELERRFLVVLFSDARVRSSVLPTLEDDDIEGLASEPILHALREAHRLGESIGYAEISEKLSDGVRRLLAALVAVEVEDVMAARSGTKEERLDNEVRGCLDQLRRRRLQRELVTIQKQIPDAEAARDYARVDDLCQRKSQLGRLLAELSAEPR
jgi:DNA primase